MSIYQCKACGANLTITSKIKPVICEYCGLSQFPFEEQTQSGATEESYIKRAFFALEDREFEKADHFCEQALNINPENPWAYLGKLLAEFRHVDQKMLQISPNRYRNSKNYKRFIQFADPLLIAELFTSVPAQEEPQRSPDKTYKLAIARMDHAKTKKDYEALTEMFQSVGDYENASQKIKECRILSQEAEKQAIYNKATSILIHSNSIQEVYEAQDLFRSLENWKDMAPSLSACERRIQELQQEKQQRQQEQNECEWSQTWIMIRKVLLVVLILLLFFFSMRSNI